MLAGVRLPVFKPTLAAICFAIRSQRSACAGATESASSRAAIETTTKSGTATERFNQFPYNYCLSIWRREWDSNPRYGFPHTRFPSVRLKPLGHLSGGPLLKGCDNFCKGRCGGHAKFIQTIEKY